MPLLDWIVKLKKLYATCIYYFLSPKNTHKEVFKEKPN